MELAELWVNSDAFHNLAMFLKDVQKITNVLMFIGKLDGVGPVDNRPSTDKLHQFVQKK